MIEEVFLWNPSERTFKPRPICPHVDCGQGLKTLGSRGLARCPACSRLYEAVLVPSPFEPNLTVEWARRATARYCTLTGERLTQPSLIDWPETGGSPARNFCTPDLMGQIFGRPDHRQRTTFRPRGGWSEPQVADPRVGAWDSIGTLSIVKGRLLAVTRRGSVAVVDPDTGEVLGQSEWPVSGINANDVSLAVESAPAAIDTYVAVVSPQAAVFRNLAHELGFESAGARPRAVKPTREDACFSAAPATVVGKTPLFCLLESDLFHAGPTESALRFFTSAGGEVGRLALPFTPSRPPLFHRESGTLLLLRADGHLYTFRPELLPAEPPPAGQPLPQFTAESLGWPSSRQDDHELPVLRPSSRPTFVYAENDAGDTDLWLLQGEQGHATVYRAGVRDMLSGASWRWDRYLLRGSSGEPNGLAVGRGAPDLHGAGNLVAFCTELGAYIYQKSSRDDHPLDVLQGPEGRGTRGSHEPPLLCGAGVVVRAHSRLFLDQLGTPWSGQFNTESRLIVGIDGEYRYPQGLVCLGSTCFVGSGLSIQAYDIAVSGAR